jgi:hypothetical protein
MTIPTGRFALQARDELPETWDAIDEKLTGGPDLLTRRAESAKRRFFGPTPLTQTEENQLDERVVQYVGKIIALSIINAGIDYWSKQRISVGARSEAITFKDRAEDLHRLRVTLLEETRLMWVEVEPLLNPTVVTNMRSRLRVREVENFHTPNPYDFGKKLDDPEIIPLPRRVIQ